MKTIFFLLLISELAACESVERRGAGVYVFPQGEAMECLGATREACGWSYKGCGVGKASFNCMPEPVIKDGY